MHIKIILYSAYDKRTCLKFQRYYMALFGGNWIMKHTLARNADPVSAVQLFWQNAWSLSESTNETEFKISFCCYYSTLKTLLSDTLLNGHTIGVEWEIKSNDNTSNSFYISQRRYQGAWGAHAPSWNRMSTVAPSLKQAAPHTKVDENINSKVLICLCPLKIKDEGWKADAHFFVLGCRKYCCCPRPP